MTSDLLPSNWLHERRRITEVGDEIPVYDMGNGGHVERIHEPMPQYR